MCEPIVPAYSKASRAVQRDTRDDGKAQEEMQIKGKAGKVEGEGKGTEGGVELGYIQAPGSLLLSFCTREAEVHLYRRQSVSHQRQTDRTTTDQRDRRLVLAGRLPESRFFPPSMGGGVPQAAGVVPQMVRMVYTPWFWTWGLPPATGRAPEEVDRHGAMLAWSSASRATLCDPIMRPGRGRAGSVVVLAGKGGMDDNAEGQQAGGRGSMSGRDLGEARDGFAKGRGQ